MARPTLPPPLRPRRPVGDRLTAVAALTVVAAVLSGCGGPSPEPSPPPATAAAPATAPPAASPNATDASPVATPRVGFAAGEVLLGAIVWTTTPDPVTETPPPVAGFPSDAPAIVAAVPIERAPAGTLLRADWRYNGAPLTGLSGSVAVDSEGGARWATFALRLPPGERWPEGSYEVAIAVDGQPALTASVEVSQPTG